MTGVAIDRMLELAAANSNTSIRYRQGQCRGLLKPGLRLRACPTGLYREQARSSAAKAHPRKVLVAKAEIGSRYRGRDLVVPPSDRCERTDDQRGGVAITSRPTPSPSAIAAMPSRSRRGGHKPNRVASTSPATMRGTRREAALLHPRCAFMLQIRFCDPDRRTLMQRPAARPRRDCVQIARVRAKFLTDRWLPHCRLE